MIGISGGLFFDFYFLYIPPCAVIGFPACFLVTADPDIIGFLFFQFLQGEGSFLGRGILLCGIFKAFVFRILDLVAAGFCILFPFYGKGPGGFIYGLLGFWLC